MIWLVNNKQMTGRINFPYLQTVTRVYQEYDIVVSHKTYTILQICRLDEDVWGPENISVTWYLHITYNDKIKYFGTLHVKIAWNKKFLMLVLRKLLNVM